MPSKYAPWVLLLFLLSSAISQADEPKGSSSLYEERLSRLKLYTAFRQGKHFFRVGEYLEAASYFLYLRFRKTELPPDIVSQVTYYLGSSLFEVGLYPQSKPLLVEAFRIRDLDPELRYYLFSRFLKLSAIYASKGDILRLLPLINREPFPGEKKEDLKFLALALLFDLGAYPEVVALLDQIPPASSIYPKALFLSALSQGYLGRFTESLEKFSRLIALSDLPAFQDPEFRTLVQKGYLAVAFEAGQYHRVLTLLETFFPESQNPDLLYLKAWSLLLSQKYPEAQALFQGFLRTYPDDPRVLEIALIPGFALIQQGKLGEGYSFFSTMEEQFFRIENHLTSLYNRFPSASQFLYYLDAETKETPFPYRTVSRWIRTDPLLSLWKEKKLEIEELNNAVHQMRWNLVRLKISLSTLGSRLDHPTSFDYRLRYQYQRQLFALRSQILEMILRPIRHLLVYQEYRYVNIAQDLRHGVLKILDQDLVPLRERVNGMIEKLRSLRDYIRLLTEVRFSEDGTPMKGEEVVLPVSFLELGDQVISMEDELGEILHRIYLDEEELWKVIRFSFDLEYTTAIRAVKRLGLWNAPHLDPLRNMYQTAQGVEDILMETSALGEKIRKEMLLFLRERLIQELRNWEILSADLRRVEKAWSDREEEMLARASHNTIQMVAGGRLRAMQGKIDIRWIRKQLLEKAGALAYDLRSKREEELSGYYSEIARLLKEIEEKERKMKALEGTSSIPLEEPRELLVTLNELEAKIQEIESAINRLAQGSSPILHRPGSLPLPQIPGQPPR
jgi:tetratricopeptide (TPR) repeat protein